MRLLLKVFWNSSRLSSSVLEFTILLLVVSTAIAVETILGLVLTDDFRREAPWRRDH